VGVISAPCAFSCLRAAKGKKEKGKG